MQIIFKDICISKYMENRLKRHDSVPYAKDYDFLNSECPRLKSLIELNKLGVQRG